MTDAIAKKQARSRLAGPPCSVLTIHEVDVLMSMELNGEWMIDGAVAKAGGFSRGISRGTIQHLKELGFVETAAYPCPGHESDWRETGNYWVMIRKVKELEPDGNWIANRLADVSAKMLRCGKLMKLMATNEGIQHGEEMIEAARLAKSWARELNKPNDQAERRHRTDAWTE